jgi:protease-4
MEQVTALDYFLATACDVIAMQPEGHFAVNGFAAEVLFYRGLFDKLGVEPQFLRHGKYKSFEEPYTRTGMSDPMRADLEGFLGSLWENFLAEAARARGLPADSLRRALEAPEIGLAHAVRARLIDTLIYADQLAGLAGGKGARLASDGAGRVARTTWDLPPKVAVVVVTGDMVLGESARAWLAGPDLAGSETVAAQLRRARRDPSVKAVVLRVDSPGGSAQAADIMRREVDLLKEAGKPVVASVGRDAASGGYYLICGADRILAARNSVVGSIGVLWGKFVLKGLYDKLGLNSETVKTSPHADANTMARAWDSTETDALQRNMDEFYRGFVAKVAAGRHLSETQVDSLGQGRIFTGSQAARNGLIDSLGGLEAAIAEARKLAGIGTRRDVEIAVFAPEGTGALPVGREWARARGLDGFASALKRETERLSALAKPDMWAIDPELAGWNEGD